MIPSAILFDFDGVIVDSFICHKSAWSEAYKQLFNESLPNIPNDHLTGAPSSIIGEYIANITGHKDRADELTNLKLDILLNSNLLPKLLPGTSESFALLQAKEIPYGIASNAPREYVQSTVTKLNLQSQVVLGFEDYTEGKPSPIPYITCANRLEIDENKFNNIIVFEDSVTGIISAKEAGMIPVGIGQGVAAAKLSENGAVRIFPSLLQAIDIIS